MQQLRHALEGTGVDEQLTACGEEGVTDVNLLRWLRARRLDVALAARCLKEHAAWRSELVGPAGHIHEV